MVVPCRFFWQSSEFTPGETASNQDAGSSAAFKETLLDLRTSSVRRQSARLGNFRTMTWLPAGSLSVAGVFPWNLSSTKISAPSGSELIVTVPTPSGVTAAALDGSADGLLSLAAAWLVIWNEGALGTARSG